MDDPAFTVILLSVLAAVLTCGCFLCMWCDDTDSPEQPAETPEQRVARRLAEWEALAVRAEAALAAQAAMATPPPPVVMPLPYFPYAVAAQGGGATETPQVECSICLEPLRQWQLYSEVPACRHVFHRECLGAWARSSGSCPLCRAKIMPGSDEVAVADDMV
ncbi:unnamed protein product [Urochloa decumbens]|uniref:RING-type E3 ubiquitin transferase n=1 Tax=Urochloa decumbens TaxID=240449 RepID=A0ABC9DFA7_9POAL